MIVTWFAAAVASAIVASPAPVAAQPQPMTLDQAITFAMSHDATVLAARSASAAAGAQLAANRAAGLLNVGGQAQSILNRQSSSNAGAFAQFGLSPSPNFSQNTTQLTASQNVFDLTTSLQAKEAQRAYDAANRDLRRAKSQATLDVMTSFYGLAEDAQLVTLALADLKYQQALVRIAQINYQTGKVAGIDVLKARIQSTTSEEHASSSEADLEDARQNLAQLIGAPADQTFALPDTIPAPAPPAGDQPSLTALALRNRPDLLAASDAFDEALIVRSLVDAADRPNVNLSGGWGNQVSPTSNAATLAACNNPSHPLGVPCGLGSSHFYSVSLTSTWTLPLLDWGAKHAARQSAAVAADEKLEAYESARRQAAIDVDQAFRRLGVNRQNLDLATANDQLAKRSADVAQVQYRTGLISQIDVTQAEQTYLQAAKDLLDAQVGYVLSVAKLKLAVGDL
jgi:outer membrane protein TolC